MSKQSDLDVNLYFKKKVHSLRNELINLRTFNPEIKALGRNLTENFAVFASYEGNRIYIDGKQIKPDSKILNNIKKVTSFVLDKENTNLTTKKKIDKLYDITNKIFDLRKLL